MPLGSKLAQVAIYYSRFLFVTLMVKLNFIHLDFHVGSYSLTICCPNTSLGICVLNTTGLNDGKAKIS